VQGKLLETQHWLIAAQQRRVTQSTFGPRQDTLFSGTSWQFDSAAALA
jgi:hypothetical protein